MRHINIQDQGRQAGCGISECDWTGELHTATEYLIATETCGAAPKETHGRFERGLRAQEGCDGGKIPFLSRQQQTGESVAMYLAVLRKLVVPCEFGQSLDEPLHDRLVCGLRDEAYQKRLLAEWKLTVDKTL